MMRIRLPSGTLRHSLKASLALATARSTSSAVQKGTRATTSWVAGLTTSRHSWLWDWTGWPSMNMGISRTDMECSSFLFADAGGPPCCCSSRPSRHPAPAGTAPALDFVCIKTRKMMKTSLSRGRMAPQQALGHIVCALMHNQTYPGIPHAARLAGHPDLPRGGPQPAAHRRRPAPGAGPLHPVAAHPTLRAEAQRPALRAQHPWLPPHRGGAAAARPRRGDGPPRLRGRREPHRQEPPDQRPDPPGGDRGPGTWMIAPLLSAFCERHPGVTLDLLAL